MLRHQTRHNQLTKYAKASNMITTNAKNKPYITKCGVLAVKLSSPKLNNNCDLTVDKIFKPKVLKY